MNKKAFGRWASTRKRNEEETLQHCNALFNTGDYGICTDGCFNVGIAGGCGPDCYVYKNGDCPEPNEIETV